MHKDSLIAIILADLEALADMLTRPDLVYSSYADTDLSMPGSTEIPSALISD